jgi:hypothetical protein
MAVLLSMCSACPPLNAQSQQEFSTVAGQVTDVVVMTHQVRILLAPLQGCLLDRSVCEALDAELRVKINAKIPKAELAGFTEMLPVVRSAGLLQVDAYNEWVLQRLVERTPSRVLVTENLVWKTDGYDLKLEVIDVRKHKGLGEFGVNVNFSTPSPDKKAVIFKDPDTGVALVVEKQFPDTRGFIKLPVGTTNRLPHPACLECAIPPLYPDAPLNFSDHLVILYSVTDTGAVEHIDVVRPVPASTASMVTSMQHWQFAPAVGDDGKPFATRVLLDIPITFYTKP